MLCSKKSYNKEKIEVHYRKVHRDGFKWVECKIDRGRFACGKVREGDFKDHIKRHNTMYSKEGSRYCMEPDRLEDLSNTEHLDVVQTMLVCLIADVEKRLEERLERDRDHSKLMTSRSSTIEWYMYVYFDSIFSKYLSGFRKGHSTQHCLLFMLERIKKALDKGLCTGILLTDLSKAFDCISHELLIAK